MKRKQLLRYTLLVILLALDLTLYFSWNKPVRLIDDRKITVATPVDVAAKREQLIRFIWGNNGFPTRKLPSQVQNNVESPISNLPNLERMDVLQINMEAIVKGIALYFIPLQKNNRLVIIHQGHDCTLNDGPGSGNKDLGMERLIHRLLSEGFAVLAVYMPHENPDDCGNTGHDKMFDAFYGTGSPLKYFLEPVAVSLNYLESQYQFEDISMVGISGGGWTTTLYAALDPRIQLSIPVAGSEPLYLRSAGYPHDKEQYLQEFYRMAGYPDLYVLGSYGAGRIQVQVLNRWDTCCFGERQHDIAQIGTSWEASVRGYETNVQATLKKLDAGSFSLYIDETATSHTISENTILNVILPTLEGVIVPLED